MLERTRTHSIYEFRTRERIQDIVEAHQRAGVISIEAIYDKHQNIYRWQLGAEPKVFGVSRIISIPGAIETLAKLIAEQIFNADIKRITFVRGDMQFHGIVNVDITTKGWDLVEVKDRDERDALNEPFERLQEEV